MRKTEVLLFSFIVCGSAQVIRAAASTALVQTNLVANSAEYNPQIVNPNLIDAWGIALRPPGAGGHIWVDNAMTGTSSEYIGDVNGIPLHQDGLTSVSMNTPNFTDHGYGFVTGIVYNAASDFSGQATEFPVSGNAHNDNTGANLGTVSGSAKFVFVTEDGAINAWLSNTATAMDSAALKVDYSKTSTYPYVANSVFSGVAMTVNHVTTAQVGTAAGNHLFAADFRNNHIEVFNDQWSDITPSFGGFQQPADVPSALHAFNIQDLSGNLFVAYAEFNPSGDEGMEQLNGQGDGRVVEYSETGQYIRTFGDDLEENAPWGMVIAPGTFGSYANDLLVGNFGDGTIDAYNLTTGAFISQLLGADGQPVSIDGLWGLTFGNGVSLGDGNSLYFTAGPNNEADGVFGKLTAVPEPTTLSLIGLSALALLGRHRRTAR